MPGSTGPFPEMNACRRVIYLAIGLVFLGPTPWSQAQQPKAVFREVLKLAGVSSEALESFSGARELSTDDWRLLAQLLHRLEQYPAAQLKSWVTFHEPGAFAENFLENVGSLVEVSGNVTSVEPLTVPADIAEILDSDEIYRCRCTLQGTGTPATLLSARIPLSWLMTEVVAEPVFFRGILLPGADDTSASRSVVFLTDRIAWHPSEGVSPGKLFLSRRGMDVSLLDEVVHYQPFVRPETSLEGEAFFACLRALNQADGRELSRLTRENVALGAEQWRKLEAQLRVKVSSSKEALSQDDSGEDLTQRTEELKSARRDLAIAMVVLRQAEKNLSSLAPLMINPDAETGQLICFEGTARRAIRIAVSDREDIDTYYEMEVFTPEAKYLRNQPVVCCVNQLPQGFPTGDFIREPVRISGVFFKNWRYRSREPAETTGETGATRPLYTPLVVGAMPIWLSDSGSDSSRWGLVAGIGFLVLLAAVWLALGWLARSDRRARAALRRNQKIDI